MPDHEIVYKIALSMQKHVTSSVVREMETRGLSPKDFFTLDTPALSLALGLSAGKAFQRMERDEVLFKARKEWEIMQRHNISGHFLLDDDYPVRLSQASDAPVFLYRVGDADLDSAKMVSVVGTRKPTPYGVDFTSRLIEDLAGYFPDLTVVSGLAYGIDAVAHTAAMKAGLPTVAVVAHGLNMIYPAQHRDLARMIVKNGGAILSEYPFGEQPYRQRFLERNRIVAGLCDVTVVAESDIKGGAMSTANTAFSYSRDVMALPGRASDKLSSGCNMLIRRGKACLITSAADLIEHVGWQPFGIPAGVLQRNLFPELDGEAKLVYDTLRFSTEPMQIDRIHSLTLIPISGLMSVLGEMEFDGIVIRHPGNRFSVS